MIPPDEPTPAGPPRSPGAKRVAAIVLAAGEARRMGQPKALLPFRGEPLIRHVIRAASECRAERVVLVVGEPTPSLIGQLGDHSVERVDNPDWREGLSSSIRCGLRQAGDVDGVLLLLADQPLVRAPVLDALLDAAAREGCDAAACSYAGTWGPPAFFGHAHFGALAQLHGDRGARVVLEAAGHVARVPFEAGALDIDTPEDYERLKRVAQSLPL